ncbi:patatin family protein [Tieghemostelium lacteum]|uniref:Patatin family protein n=1 Tax=Tieghemostelium lacteum TaxID=361077 RepID=A0A151Z8M0_TIELA|nr:patatin family protein [Tieghemostelium lacteum]|eukprot:KYQ90313.1 patatin family protein [Tieghemostelium lacteum]
MVIQPWMAMMIGVIVIIAVFRIYEYFSDGGWKRRHKRKDSIGDPLLLLKQMMNTKPKRFFDIFPDELKELAKRRVNVLKEKDPFKISTLFPAYSYLSTHRSRINSSKTPPLNKRHSKNVLFHTPQALQSSNHILNSNNLNNIHSGSTGSTSQSNSQNSTFKHMSESPFSIGGVGTEKMSAVPGSTDCTDLVDTIRKSNSFLHDKDDNPSPLNLSPVVSEGTPLHPGGRGGRISESSSMSFEQPTIETLLDDINSDTYSTSNQSVTTTNTTLFNTEFPETFINPIITLPSETIDEMDNENLNSSTSSTSSKELLKKPSNIKVVPSVDFNLVGLALSGGGIRSATFNLGLLQALSKHKFFKKIDYLSTVSGGGFIGSCLVSLLSEGTYTTDWHNFPFHYGRGLKEGAPLTHLRNSANYLANGIFEFLLFPVLVLRGIVLNLVSIFPFVWLLLLFERYVPLFGDGYFLTVRIGWNLLIHIILFPMISRPKFTMPLLAGFVFIYYSEISKILSRIGNVEIGISMALHLYLNHPMLFKKEGGKVWYDRSFGWLFIVLIVTSFTESLPMIENIYIHYFGGINDTSFRVYPLISLIALILADSLAFTLLTNPKLSPLKRLVFHVIVSIIGPLLLILTYLELSVWLDVGSSFFGIGNGLCFSISLLSLFTLDINETSMHKYYRDRLSKAYMFSIKNGRFRSYGGEKVSRLNRRSVGPYLLINTALNSVTNSEGVDSPNSRGTDFFIFSQHFCGSESSGYRSTEQMERLDRRLDLATAVSISGAAVGTKMGTSTIPTLVMSLGILNIRLGYWLPNPLGIFLSHPYLGRLFYGGFACYHLVKEFGWTAMTSRDWCINLSDGGHIENLGAYELIKRKCKYIIVSDAEADPDMTFPSMAQLMRLVRIDFGINIQINLDDIRRSANGYSKKHWTVGKIIYQKKSSYSNSTSAHHHNINSNNNNNNINSSQQAFNPSLSSSASTEPNSAPPNGEVGYLLYIKSCLTGDEDEIIKEYQSQHPSFPHESTTDQFFTEAQFESYRSLGYHIGGSNLFGPKHNRLFDGENVESFFERIYQQCTGDLPSGWQEKMDDRGSKYFVQEDMKKKTWFDPRLRSKTPPAGTNTPI